ncbi:MAG: M24 family metallopeptidase, partial [Dehalococcoidia bacterium]
MTTQPSFRPGLLSVDWEQRIDYQRMRRQRLEKAQRHLAESEADALLLIAPENVRYVTGLRSQDMPQVHFGRAACLLLSDREPVVYTPFREYAEEALPWLRGRVSRLSPWGMDTLEGAQALAQDVRAWLAELGATPGKVGVDFWTPALVKALPEGLPGVQWVDGQGIIMQARMIKTEDEQACLKMAYAVTAAGMEVARQVLRPGVRECEVQAACFATMYALGSEWQQQSGIITSDTYPYRRLATDKIIGYGDLVVMDVGARVNGYMGDLTRTWVCGKGARPTKEQVRVHMQAYRAMKRAEEAVGPGVTTREVYRACGEENIMSALLGHGLGLGNEPPLIGPIPRETVFTLQP